MMTQRDKADLDAYLTRTPEDVADTMAAGAGSGLRERAAEALTQHREEEAQSAQEALQYEEERKRELLAGLLRKRLRVEADGFAGTGSQLRARVGDLEFSADQSNNYRGSLLLWGTCPKCGQETVSDDIGSLVGLGRLLETFEPAHYHSEDCRNELLASSPRSDPAPEPPTPEKRLLAALAALIDERMELR